MVAGRMDMELPDKSFPVVGMSGKVRHPDDRTAFLVIAVGMALHMTDKSCPVVGPSGKLRHPDARTTFLVISFRMARAVLSVVSLATPAGICRGGGSWIAGESGCQPARQTCAAGRNSQWRTRRAEVQRQRPTTDVLQIILELAVRRFLGARLRACDDDHDLSSRAPGDCLSPRLAGPGGEQIHFLPVQQL